MFIDFVGRKKPLLNNKNETTIPQGKKVGNFFGWRYNFARNSNK